MLYHHYSNIFVSLIFFIPVKMFPSNKKLEVKESSLPNAGMGLFTKINLNKGDIVTEYKGRRCTWKQVEDDVDNGYIYHIDDENVIDAKKVMKSFGRYANDALGLMRIKGITNNAEYVEENNRVYIVAKRNLKPGDEVFVPYGRLYWKQVKENIELDRKWAKTHAGGHAPQTHAAEIHAPLQHEA